MAKAFEQPRGTYTGIAGESFVGKRYVPVKLHTDGTIKIATAATDVVIGVAQEEGNSGDEIRVMTSGISFAIASAAIAYGVPVAATTDGKVVAQTATSSVYTIGTGTVGTALISAAAAGEYISVLLK